MILCFRCGGEIRAEQVWDLDHDDHDPSQSFPSHEAVTERPRTATPPPEIEKARLGGPSRLSDVVAPFYGAPGTFWPGSFFP